MAYRKQKRWWNAYILFYERVDEVDNEKHIYKTLQDLTIGKIFRLIHLNVYKRWIVIIYKGVGHAMQRIVAYMFYLNRKLIPVFRVIF
jgi:hypothetical protein